MSRNGLLIDYEYCCGCHTCEVACQKEHDYPVEVWGMYLNQMGPYRYEDYHDVILYEYLPMPTDLCDLCVNRLRDGREPVCMHNCLADVIRFGTIDEMAEELKRKPKQVLWTPCDIEL